MVENSTNQIALPSYVLIFLEKLIALPSFGRIDLFNILLISIGLECGFYDVEVKPQFCRYKINNFDKNFIIECATQTANYQPNTNFFNKFVFKFTRDPEARVLISCILSAESVIVTACHLKNNSRVTSGFSIALPLSRYVPFNFNRDFPHKTFRKLKELSRELKNNIFLPIRCDIYRNLGLINPSLFGIPEEVLDKILHFLNAHDLVNFKSLIR